ncbi:MAG: DUF3883 domain-containing protein [bacterium]|nr:DUF3883 domain-containing protein [bacterium]
MISEIQTITRFLASVIALETSAGAREEDVTEYYTTQYVYPVRDAFDVVRDFCVETELTVREGTKLRLGDLGKNYLNLSDKKDNSFILEPNRKQKDFLSRKVFLIPKILDLVKKILYNFRKSQNGELWLSKDEAAILQDQNFLDLLIQLEILIEKKDTIELAPQYIEFLEMVVSDTIMVVTPSMLEKSQIGKMEVAIIAEKYVLQNERNRLNNIDAVEQSKKVDHVALRNVAAGYDIASFNDKNSQSQDRFIEVKAGISTPINFFFTRNEFETATRLKARYFIYYVCIKDKKPNEIYVFQNPIEGIMKDLKFKIITDTYEISEN